MFKKKILLTALGSLALVAGSANAALYEYTFDVDATTNTGTGSAVATTQGTPTITAGGFSGSFADFDGGDAVGSDAIDVNIAGDGLTLGNFQISLYINDAGNAFDDFLAFDVSDGSEFYLERHGGSGGITLFSSAGVSIDGATDGLADGNWHLLELSGTTSGLDAVFSLSIDGIVQATGDTLVGGAALTFDDVRIGGRLSADNRSVDAGIDEVTIDVPEPGSLALLALGGLAMLRRRRA